MATKWFLPVFLVPAIQLSPIILHLPLQEVSAAVPLHQEHPGCVGGSKAWAVWQCQESARRCSERECLAGKEGERRRAGEGEPALSPRVAIFSRAI